MFTIAAAAPVEGIANSVNETAEQSKNVLIDSFWTAFGQVIEMAPKVLAMLLVLVVGYIIARLVGKAVTTVCEKLGLHRAAERGGLVNSMQQVGIERTVPQIIGSIVFWLLMFVFLMAALNILGLTTVSAAVGKVVDYIPALLTATVMVVVGLMLANFLRGLVATGADRLGISYAAQLASGVYYMLVLMIAIAAFEQLNIEFGPLANLILIAFASVAVAFGLAVGLGGRDVVAGILSGYYVRQRMESGDRVTVAGFDGTVREVGPVATIIETEEDGMLQRHSIPNTKMLQEAVR
jgi:small-conductance mechanosensitive channel